MTEKVFVVGVGLTKFEKPGRREGWDYPDMAREAGTAALADAGIDFSLVEQGYVGYVYGESTAGQRALYELGMTGIPVVNVNNNCSTGSTALYLAAQAIRGGLANCCMALGFEKMKPGSLGVTFDDRAQPMERPSNARPIVSSCSSTMSAFFFTESFSARIFVPIARKPVAMIRSGSDGSIKSPASWSRTNSSNGRSRLNASMTRLR